MWTTNPKLGTEVLLLPIHSIRKTDFQGLFTLNTRRTY